MDYFAEQLKLFLEKYREHYATNQDTWDDLRWRLERILERLGDEGAPLLRELKTQTEVVKALHSLHEWENMFTEVLVTGKLDDRNSTLKSKLVNASALMAGLSTGLVDASLYSHIKPTPHSQNASIPPDVMDAYAKATARRIEAEMLERAQSTKYATADKVIGG